MKRELENLVDGFAAGAITRRELIAKLLLLSVAPVVAAGAAAQKAPERIEVAGLDHLALRVSDLARSKRFYMENLSMTVRSESSEGVFLHAGRDWIALFDEKALTSSIPRRSGPGVDHFSFRPSSHHTFEATMAALRARNLNPVSPGDTRRIYFRDPDGIVVQLSPGEMS